MQDVAVQYIEALLGSHQQTKVLVYTKNSEHYATLPQHQPYTKTHCMPTKTTSNIWLMCMWTFSLVWWFQQLKCSSARSQKCPCVQCMTSSSPIMMTQTIPPCSKSSSNRNGSGTQQGNSRHHLQWEWQDSLGEWRQMWYTHRVTVRMAMVNAKNAWFSILFWDFFQHCTKSDTPSQPSQQAKGYSPCFTKSQAWSQQECSYN